MTKSSIPSLHQFSMENWRGRFVRTILRTASVLGLFALVFAFTPGTILPLQIIYGVIYAVILIATLAPVPDFARAGLVIAMTYLLAVSSFLDVGLWGVSRLYLLGFILLANLLFSYRTSLVALTVSLVTLAVFGWLIVSGNYVITSTVVQAGRAEDWWGGATTFLMIAVTINIAVNMLQNEFQRAYQSGQAMVEELTSKRQTLEERVSERTSSLEKRTAELSAANAVTQSMAAAKEIESLLPVVVHAITEHFKYYHAGLYLLDEKMEYGYMQAASSEGGKRMLTRQQQVSLSAEGLIQKSVTKGARQVVHNLAAESVKLENPDLPLTRARVAFPLLARDRVIGILDIHAVEPEAFQQTEVETLQIIADQLSLAIDNARLFTEMQAIIEQMQQTSDMSSHSSWTQATSRRAPAYLYTPLAVQKISILPERREETGSVSIPILLRGRKIGKIHLKRKTGAGIWAKEEQSMIGEVAKQVGLALENARLLEDAQTRAARERTLGDISARISAAVDVEAILRTTVQEIGKALGDSEVTVQLNPQNVDA